MIVVAALYQFVALPNYLDLQAPLLSFCKTHGVKGTLLLAAEGINGTIAGTRSGIDAVAAYLIICMRFCKLLLRTRWLFMSVVLLCAYVFSKYDWLFYEFIAESLLTQLFDVS